MQVRGHDLRDVRDALCAEALEDERDGLDDGPVVHVEGRVADVAHQDRYGDGRVEVFQGPGRHVYEQLAGVDVTCSEQFPITSEPKPRGGARFQFLGQEST